MSRASDLQDLANSLTGVGSALAGVDQIAGKVENNIAAMNAALSKFGEEVLQGSVGLSTDLPDYVKPGSAAPNSKSQAAYDQQVIDELQADSDKIKAALGADNFIASEFDKSIGYIRDQRLSGQDALRRLQAVLWNWQGGLFQEESSQNRTLATLAAELLSAINSGNFNF